MVLSKIVGTGSFLPKRVLKNDHFRKTLNLSDDWILSRTGIRERHVVDEGVFTSDLAATAAKSALDMSGVDPEDVDLFILATMTPDQPCPSTASRVQVLLNLKNAAVFDLGATYAGFMYGLAIADQCVKTGFSKRVLVVGADVMSSILDYSDKNTAILFGDGAGAVVLAPSDDDSGICSTHLFSDGLYADLIEVPAGGVKLPSSHETIEQGDHYIKMKGRELFREAVLRLVKASRTALDSNHLSVDDLDLAVPHQANMRIIKAMSQRLSLPMDKVYVVLDRTGNTGAASQPIALDHANREGAISKGDTILLSAMGAGVSYGSAIVRW